MVGTSNTIRRNGYMRFLRTLEPDLAMQVEAVGGSTSVLLPYVLGCVPVSGVSHVVIDTFVNDVMHAARSPDGGDVCESVLFQSAEWLVSQGKRVALVLLPQLNAGTQQAALRARWRARAAQSGIVVIDGCGIADALADQADLGKSELFLDPQHPAWPVTLILAQRISAFLHEELPAGRVRPTTPAPFQVVAPISADGATLQRQTALLSKSYACLAGDQSGNVALRAPMLLVGVALNAARRAGMLEIKSETGQVMLELDYVMEVDSGKQAEMRHVIMTLPRPLLGRRFDVMAVPGTQTSAERPPGVEVEALVFCAPDVAAKVAPAPASVEAERSFPATLLTPAELAIGVAAGMTPVQTSNADILGFYRQYVMGIKPIWAAGPVRTATIMADLAALCGGANVAKRVLIRAMKDLPDSVALKEHLAEIRAGRTAKSQRKP